MVQLLITKQKLKILAVFIETHETKAYHLLFLWRLRLIKYNKKNLTKTL